MNRPVPPPTVNLANDYSAWPDANGRFGDYGGRYVPETLMPLVLALETAFLAAKADPAFQAELAGYLTHYVGRPSPLYFARRLTEHFGGAKIYLKREELNHTGAHKINNCMGQILLARRMGKTRIIAETGAGQHGVATATVCALFGLPCIVYMGAVDVERQAPNVLRMNLLGRRGSAGDQRRGDPEGRHERGAARLGDQCRGHLLPDRLGGRPAPLSGDGAGLPGGDRRRDPGADSGRRGPASGRAGRLRRRRLQRHRPLPPLPRRRVAWRIFGVEAAGDGMATRRHAAALNGGRPGVLHGNKTYLLQDADGQILEAHSISAGLDYPGIGPEHAWLHDVGRARYLTATDDEALEAFQLCARLEGIVPALESAHALARLPEVAGALGKDAIVVLNLSGRGDKDLATVAARLGRAI